ncbi:MAG: DUF4167 domain-containing protein [Alphaproteobacteria bacterium]|nr:DUF4167 domain-containing protein [Alphaproteobacteria bacterium]
MSTGKDLFRNKKPFTPTQKTTLGRSSVIESHGPEGKVRGNAQQLIDRYIVLGKDALRDSDVVLAESYFQHAEHYRRLLGGMRRETPEPKQTTQNTQRSDDVQEEETIILAPSLTYSEPAVKDVIVTNPQD